MSKSSAITSIIFLFVANLLQAQELSYTIYDKKDGLAGSTTYSMVQDKDGFLWIGTETGLSRFDGSRFTNFSTLDGLPDNEILNLFADSKGRVWIMTFRIRISYYYKGKIYTQENDSVLRKIQLKNNVFSMAEDREGNILLVENGSALHEIKTDGRVFSYKAGENEFYIAAAKGPNGGFCVRSKAAILSLNNNRLTKRFDVSSGFSHTNQTSFSANHVVFRSDFFNVEIRELNTGKLVKKLKLKVDLIKVTLINDSVLAFNRRRGTDIVNIRDTLKEENYLNGIPVNCAFVDSEKNWWLCTEGYGLRRLNSKTIRTISTRSSLFENIGVNVVQKANGKYIAGGYYNYLFELVYKDKMYKIIRTVLTKKVSRSHSTVYNVYWLSKNKIFYGAGDAINTLDSNYSIKKTRSPISSKCVEIESDSTILLGTNHNIERFDFRKFRPIDTIWYSRPTCLLKWNDTLYIGGLEGLVRLTNNYSKSENLGEQIPILNNRIAAVKRANDGSIWVGMYGGGVLIMKNEKIVGHLTSNNGLNSNVCKSIFIDNSSAWVTTDKGISRVTRSDTGYQVLNLTVADGLPSETINSVFVDEGRIIVASSRGFSYFNDGDLTQESICNLVISGLRVNDQFFAQDSTNFILKNDMNNIYVEFAGISFKSGGDINYRYRLLGLESKWQSTRSNFLSYPSLPSGEYRLQIQAINKFGKASEIREIVFEVEKKIIERFWFRFLIVGVIAGAVFFVLRSIVKRIRIREESRRLISGRIAELEQLALKSQMNPHFIFNSLNSIQHYVMNKDIAGANKFISDFSRLIRSTLDYSSKSTIPIMDEVVYLRTYLELEKTRLENKFRFEIKVTQAIEEGDFVIPPMLLQPYVENSIRHGIRFRNDNEGLVQLHFSLQGNFVVCVIQDNGIGRKAASQYKMNSPIEYQSKGMSLTESRVSYINRHLESKVTVLIEDLVDQNLDALGTRVTLKIPDSLV